MTAVAAGRDGAGGRSARGVVEMIFRARELSLVAALAVLVAVTAAANPNFLSGQGVKDIFLNTSILALLAVGQSLIVITRNIDLSVGSVVGLVAFTTGQFLAADPGGRGVALALVYGIAVGAACGLVNGLLVSFCRVPALVVTLGTLYVIQGLDHYIAHGRQINAVDLPPAVLALGNEGVFGVPYLPIITVAVMLATGYYLRSYPSGRDFYAIGSSPEAARLAGVPVRRRVLAAYLFSGALAGLAGVLWLARFGTVVADSARGWELLVVSAVVVGGVAIVGGVGTVYGAALGALLLTTIGSALVVLKVNSFWQQALTGALLLLAITVDRVLAVRVTRLLRRRSVHHGA
ncbi:ABC transporter permease [Sphaerisporangium perillae]|uniref:ABC transporter permease n=1 Tax=Sphaerisporangium perillae TaxID=2935860 RepID=UPI0020102917|nr:ABC transporter permease [Sphaerisporangium perillae]